MKNLKKVLLIAALLALFPQLVLAQSKNNVIDEIAWVIGDEYILLSDIERQRLYYESMGERMSGNARCVIPEQMAVQKLFLNQADIDSIFVNPGMVNQSVSQWIEAVTNELGSRDKVEEYLGRNMSQIREERTKVVTDEYRVMQMQQKLIGDVKVSPSEVNRYYDVVNKDSLPFMPQTVEVQIITLEPKIPFSEVDRIKERLIGFTNDINSGKSDFETLARIYSNDNATALKGGEIGMVGRAELEPEFANVAFGLNDTKKVSRIVKTARGYHIMQLIDKQDDKINVRHIMLRPEVGVEELSKTTALMDSIVGQIKADSLDFGVAARLFSSDENTRLGNGQMVNDKQKSNHFGTSRFAMEDLPQEMSPVVANLKEGDISKPFTMTNKDSNTVVAVVLLKKRIAGHRANVVDDYQVIKQIVLNKKQDEVLEEWIKKKQKSTYTRISPRYQHCDFKYPGWGSK
ncbi:peptidylprolyl isomerase [Porphyromonadaceae bacterium W3.11]|nr:peptidylprolyl isomerase [Porphyromonadaceae bacterium W3.11]